MKLKIDLFLCLVAARYTPAGRPLAAMSDYEDEFEEEVEEDDAADDYYGEDTFDEAEGGDSLDGPAGRTPPDELAAKWDALRTEYAADASGADDCAHLC